jgi:hypothetical protein
MSRAGRPPGWPGEVPPPQVEGWQPKAVGWLLDQCPAEYRGYPVVRRHPEVLAWLAGHQVDAQLEAARRSYGQARRTFGPALGPEVVAETLAALESEGARLLALQRSVRLVADALQRT